MTIESFLRGFERGLQKRAQVAVIPGMSSPMPARQPTAPSPMNMGLNPAMKKPAPPAMKPSGMRPAGGM